MSVVFPYDGAKIINYYEITTKTKKKNAFYHNNKKKICLYPKFLPMGLYLRYSQLLSKPLGNRSLIDV